MKFKQFLTENKELLGKIQEVLDEMSSEELDEFGLYLADTFLDDLPEDEYEDAFTKEDILEMLDALGVNLYDEILDELSVIRDSESGESEEMDEAVSRRMKSSDYQRKKRKYMQVSKSELRRTKAKRKIAARKSKAKRKRYYKANKQKIAKYQQSRAEAIKKGKHKPKQRRAS